MFSIIILACIGLILMGPIGHPSLIIFTPCLPLNFWVVFAIAIYGLILHYVHVPIILLFYLLFMTTSLFYLEHGA